MTGKLKKEFDMHVSHVGRDVSVVGCTGKREMEINLDRVDEVSTASGVGTKVESGSGSNEGF